MLHRPAAAKGDAVGREQAERLSGDPRYIFVDLDGTLARTDVFVECVVMFVKRNPLNLFRLLLWLLQGRANAKSKVAEAVSLDVTTFPYNALLLEFLAEQKEAGRQIILATAANRALAQRVADHLGVFDGVIASDAEQNVKGARKLTAIRDYSAGEPFVYAGDSSADRPIWREAAKSILVDASSNIRKEEQEAGRIEREFRQTTPLAQAILREMRPHQWIKNALIFLPLLTAHAYQDLELVLLACLAFVSFSLCASGVYFLNDLLDLEADRVHKRKRFRPLASGALPIRYGVIGAIGLPAVSLAMAVLFLPSFFVVVLLTYYGITVAYSLRLKALSTTDVLTLAMLYTLRVAAGSAVTGIELSSWLLAFTVFLFVSLAYLKRYIEVAALDETSTTTRGRDYSRSDAEAIFSLGVASSTAAVLVLALFVSSDEVRVQYASPDTLWGLCFLMLYWGNRVWIAARRGEIHHDPIVFALKDGFSRAIGVAFVAVLLVAKYAA